MATNNLFNQTLRTCEKHHHLRWSWSSCQGLDWWGLSGQVRLSFFWKLLPWLASVSIWYLGSMVPKGPLTVKGLCGPWTAPV